MYANIKTVRWEKAKLLTDASRVPGMDTNIFLTMEKSSLHHSRKSSDMYNLLLMGTKKSGLILNQTKKERRMPLDLHL